MAAPDARRFVVSVWLAAVVVGVLMLTSGIGSVFNRSRGGFIHFGPINGSDPHHEEILPSWYWPSHILSRVFMALPTGLLVLLLGLHCRAAAIVALLTWFSLYVGWGSYMNIGLVDNYHSRSGYLDWLIGRQGINWSIDERYVREYTGMALRGLIWTAPQGYLLEHLGFGWEYSLSGSMMGMVYYVGAHTNLTHVKSSKFISDHIALSEVLWGWFIWFVLSIVCLSQLVRRARLWVHKHNPYLGYKPFSHWEVLKYDSLNRSPFRIAYEIFITILNVLYCCSLAFYALVEQKDLRNKGQTFFGLFTAILCLTMTQGWRWSTCYLRWKLRKISRALKRQSVVRTTATSPGSPPPVGAATPKTSLRGGQLSRNSNKAKNEPLQKAVARVGEGYKDYGSAARNEADPLLEWPYSHPDRVSPVPLRGGGGVVKGNNNRLVLPEGETELGMAYHLQPASTSTAVSILWQNIENWVWMDIFIWLRRFFGIIFVLNIALLTIVTVMATIQGWGNPRFMQQCSVH